MEIRKCTGADIPDMLSIINAAAQAYRGVIPEELYHEPYMPQDALLHEIASGIAFFAASEGGRIVGVIGIQDKGEVTLVRHAYVAPAVQRKGIATALLQHLCSLSAKPILIGTWAAASWAIAFYRRNGFAVVPDDSKDALLRRYWSITSRQVKASVVLANGVAATTPAPSRPGSPSSSG